MIKFCRNLTFIGALTVAIPTIVGAQSFHFVEDMLSSFSKGADINQMREDAEATFDLLDENDNGRITLEEIDISFDDVVDPAQQRSMRRRASVAQAKFMRWDEDVDRFEIVDTNHDGILDRDEYAEEDATLRTHSLQLGIDELDEDKNGSVDLVEFTAHLEILEELDEDGDGRLSREEYAKADDPSIVKDAVLSSFHIFGDAFDKFNNVQVFADQGAAVKALDPMGVWVSELEIKLESKLNSTSEGGNHAEVLHIERIEVDSKAVDEDD